MKHDYAAPPRTAAALLQMLTACWVKMAIIQEIFDFAVLDEQTG